MDNFMDQLQEILQCPVCYNLPRQLPIQSCPAGHIICQDCRPSVGLCPTCRVGPLFSTNTVAGNLVSIMAHKCKFNALGCNVRLPLDEIAQHEKYCVQRTVICPFRGEFKQTCHYNKHFDTFVRNKSLQLSTLILTEFFAEYFPHIVLEL